DLPINACVTARKNSEFASAGADLFLEEHPRPAVSCCMHPKGLGVRVRGSIGSDRAQACVSRWPDTRILNRPGPWWVEIGHRAVYSRLGKCSGQDKPHAWIVRRAPTMARTRANGGRCRQYDSGCMHAIL